MSGQLDSGLLRACNPTDIRKFRAECRPCPRTSEDGTVMNNRMASYYCCCMVAFHPGACFTEYHEGKPESYRPRKRISRQIFNPDPDMVV